MKTSIKKKLLAYIQEHNDGSATANFLIRTLEHEVNYADCDSFSVCTEDLNDYYDQKGLRRMLGKDDKSPYTESDCEKVAELLSDAIAEEFTETISNIIANHS